MELGQTEWVLWVQLAYVVGIISVCLIVIFDTRSVSKTLAYLLLVIFVPIAGAIFYFSFGINYRKRKIYSKKLIADELLAQGASEKLKVSNDQLFNSCNTAIDQNKEMIHLLSNKKAGGHPILPNNEVEVLLNGEVFFPLLMEELKKAKHHIHIQYYIYENDTIGNQLKDLLILKASEGVVVRFIYDDFGSKNIRGNIVRDLNRSGVRAVPFNKIKLLFLANRVNYRNHRKIVVIDGKVAFTGGINVCDKYINNGKNDLFWRDTNVLIKGPAIFGLQQVFLSDWNFCCKENLGIDRELFPINIKNPEKSQFFLPVFYFPTSGRCSRPDMKGRCGTKVLVMGRMVVPMKENVNFMLVDEHSVHTVVPMLGKDLKGTGAVFFEVFLKEFALIPRHGGIIGNVDYRISQKIVRGKDPCTCKGNPIDPFSAQVVPLGCYGQMLLLGKPIKVMVAG